VDRSKLPNVAIGRNGSRRIRDAQGLFKKKGKGKGSWGESEPAGTRVDIELGVGESGRLEKGELREGKETRKRSAGC